MSKSPAHESDAVRDATLKMLSTPPKPKSPAPKKKPQKN